MFKQKLEKERQHFEAAKTKYTEQKANERHEENKKNKLEADEKVFKQKEQEIGNKKEENTSYSSMNMSVNVFLWRGALETIDFMPISSADQIGGVIITDWYSTSSNINERCKLNIFISGKSLKTENLRVASFCQEYKNQIWVNKEVNDKNNIKIENAILNKAKKLRLQSN